ncbi:MAG: protein-export chaperone SecB [Desulfotignum sp.]|nr:protein-export chaperone SecB [Desulfotignum sp.]MCF8089751.1 protein-export chaperone SecB [Desulfotignum sp.]
MKSESGFQLKEHRILKSHFSINEDLDEDEGIEKIQLKPQLALKYEKTSDEGDITVFFSFKIVDNDAPFMINLVLAGDFRVTGDALEDKDALERLTHINCAACLFPFVREYVADITRRGGFPILYLPSMNFVEFYKESIKNICKE